eukprot:CAMPEP_0175130322 /NCGR_PEP_ID=MMETSP0087-20121206/5947_1 /TAXON_ID=136419 /ORGANISM="Unknown Unknown, Strain D1" /LENGTH=256 /DNA_ID=CAMNT_0016412537 /DNA_START=197 /DNA_END=967 /DNA_ORIENTATION=-
MNFFLLIGLIDLGQLHNVLPQWFNLACTWLVASQLVYGMLGAISAILFEVTLLDHNRHLIDTFKWWWKRLIVPHLFFGTTLSFICVIALATGQGWAYPVKMTYDILSCLLVLVISNIAHVKLRATITSNVVEMSAKVKDAIRKSHIFQHVTTFLLLLSLLTWATRLKKVYGGTWQLFPDPNKFEMTYITFPILLNLGSYLALWYAWIPIRTKRVNLSNTRGSNHISMSGGLKLQESASGKLQESASSGNLSRPSNI